MAERVLAEILEVRVVSSRGRINPRAVKRKMSGFPTKHRTRGTATKMAYSIRILSSK